MRHPRIYAILVVVVAAVAYRWFIGTSEKPQPSYGGKALSYWVEKLPKGVSSEEEYEVTAALIAIRYEATNVVELIMGVRKPRSRWK